jgi:hypothetical protein
MEMIGGFWVDSNRNRWDCHLYTHDTAMSLSETLKDCSGCSGCRDCRGCSGCIYCRGCSDCSDCHDCSNCSNCINCSDCIYCRNCSGCIYCRGCSDCSDCSDFKSQPQTYMTGKIGSRNDVTRFYKHDGIIHVVCGCFRGDIEKFEKQVKETYCQGQYHDEYMAEVEKVKALFREVKTWENQ